MYRLLALDIDLTLLDHAGMLRPETHQALAAARAQGVEITLVTARSWTGTERFVAELGLTLPVICMTGAAWYAPDGALVRHTAFPADSAARLLARADAEEWAVRLYFPEGEIIQSRPAPDFEPQHESARYLPAPLVGAVTPHAAGRPLIQAVLLGVRSTEALLAHLDELPGLTVTPYDRGTAQARVHLMHAAVSKGAALADFCAAYGFAREDVIAMGDGEPDLSMIRWAGAGVAMGWAPAHVQAGAGLVTAPDDPHPVATAIRWLLG